MKALMIALSVCLCDNDKKEEITAEERERKAEGRRKSRRVKEKQKGERTAEGRGKCRREE